MTVNGTILRFSYFWSGIKDIFIFISFCFFFFLCFFMWHAEGLWMVITLGCAVSLHSWRLPEVCTNVIWAHLPLCGHFHGSIRNISLSVTALLNTAESKSNYLVSTNGKKKNQDKPLNSTWLNGVQISNHPVSGILVQARFYMRTVVYFLWNDLYYVIPWAHSVFPRKWLPMWMVFQAVRWDQGLFYMYVYTYKESLVIHLTAWNTINIGNHLHWKYWMSSWVAST